MAFDLITTYFPAFEEIPTATLKSMRERLLAWQQVTRPDLDMRPGSVYGTWGLDPVSNLLAGVEVMLDRVRGDLDVAGVAQGIVYDCDFVEKFLAGLGAVRQESITTLGYVRLEFEENVDVDIPGGIRFQFNEQDTFVPLTFPAGPIRIRKVGTTSTSSQVLPLRVLGQSRYAVVLPVTGYSTSILAGDIAAVDQTVQGLVAVQAISDFQVGRVNNSVPALADRTSRTFQAAGFATRGGIQRELEQVLPDLVSVSAIASGDAEMLRFSNTTLGVGDGALDVLVRSSSQATYQQEVLFEYVVDQDAVEVNRFIAVWSPLSVPTRIESIVWIGDETINLDYEILARSTDNTRAPLLTCAYSSLEQFEVVIRMPTDSGIPAIQTDVLTTGQFARFRITYTADPGVAAVAQYCAAEEPAGMDVLARAPVQLLITRLIFNYTKKPGVLFNTEQAMQDIENYLSALAPPDRLSPADLNDRVYSAGASRILSVETRASLKLSIADRVVPAGTATALEDWAAVDAAALDVPRITLSDVTALNPTYLDPLLGETTATMGAAGVKNICYVLLPDALAFHHDANA